MQIAENSFKGPRPGGITHKEERGERKSGTYFSILAWDAKMFKD